MAALTNWQSVKSQGQVEVDFSVHAGGSPVGTAGGEEEGTVGLVVGEEGGSTVFDEDEEEDDDPPLAEVVTSTAINTPIPMRTHTKMRTT